MVLLLVTGIGIAPSLIIGTNLIDHLGPWDRLSEAQSWPTTAFTSGGAAGTALAGVLVDAGGPRLSFLGAGLGVTGAVALALGAQRRWRQTDAASVGHIPVDPSIVSRSRSA
jgi:predicted MFS family arabinose efflux permease